MSRDRGRGWGQLEGGGQVPEATPGAPPQETSRSEDPCRDQASRGQPAGGAWGKHPGTHYQGIRRSYKTGLPALTFGGRESREEGKGLTLLRLG